LFSRLISHINGGILFFGLLAVASFWFAIQLCWTIAGKQWYSVVWRLVGVLALFVFGVIMIFFTAFGAN
jgi:hypothetical protein